jgi:hypothetical protein
MNDSPNFPPPPFGDDTDEALSALLDGELGAFAEARELTEDAARARLEAWPGAEARLAELDRVRASVRAPVPALDDVTRRRLVRNASEAVPVHSTPGRAPRPWAKIVAIAAAGLIVVGGIGVAVSSIDGGSNGSSSQESAGSSAGVPRLSGDVGDLGDVTSAAAQRALLDGRDAATGKGADSSDSSNAASAAPETGASTAVPSPTAPALDVGAVDPAACALELAGTRDVVFSGTGTYQGAAVTIIGVAKGGRTIVFVVSATDCSNVLASVSR